MSLEKRIYNVFPDDARYRQARYRESANHPDWSPIDDALGSLKPARGQWRVFDLPTTGRDLPAADFFYFCLGTLAIRREAEQRLHFRERFRGSAEFLPFTVEGEPCFVIHFTAEHVALDYARSPHHRISNGRIIANSCGPEIFRADINIKDWLFRIEGTVCIYTLADGPDSFFEVYQHEGMTGLCFTERRIHKE